MIAGRESVSLCKTLGAFSPVREWRALEIVADLLARRARRPNPLALADRDGMIEIVRAIERRHSAHDKMAIGPEHGQLLAKRGVFLRRQGAQCRKFPRIEAVLGDKRQIDVAITVAETAVGEAADEVCPDQPCAELRPIQRRECTGKGERGSVRPLIFGVDVFSRHKTRPVSRRAFLALELPRAVRLAIYGFVSNTMQRTEVRNSFCSRFHSHRVL